ncbi:DUF1905 domain-containing protein [Microbacterium bovistercoris]|uniref:DUF1905 domain-containing protein n=1 Tax=Microbacterium bovistercoris TaxID=2293570 RepID=A0A371NR57_9MICO|nr:DUF1905 domain-containing protein [Microbacterium bovistercoris]REJ04648.1 DUF1905 domain-containing protein [Microbacterium bovistercoris]
MRIEYESDVVRWDARTEAWFFAVMPEDLSQEIRELPSPPRGFGSLRVRARIGDTEWATSIFPGRDGYVLPLKKQVRSAEAIEEGGTVVVELEILDL